MIQTQQKTVDKWLITQAQNKAGRCVHKVYSLIQAYMMAVDLCGRDPDCREWELMADAKERALRVFVKTGNLLE